MQKASPLKPAAGTPYGENALRGRFADAHRWAAHFFSEGNAVHAQMEQIKQEKDKKEAKRQGATHDKR